MGLGVGGPCIGLRAVLLQLCGFGQASQHHTHPLWIIGKILCP